MNWRAIAGFRIVTADPHKLLPFYAALGFTIREPIAVLHESMAMLGISGAGRRWQMRLGQSHVDIDQYEQAGRPYPGQADAASLCFQHLALVTSDVGASWERAEAAGATAISGEGPVTLPIAVGGATAIKFRDPEGHPLELIAFPPGASTWTGRGVLGIDHSAVSVADASISRSFFAGYGLLAGDATKNRGAMQAKLDGLDGARVDVIPMRPASLTPHLELLNYRHPRPRSCGAVAANDVAATRILWRAETAGLVRDPDGHLHECGSDHKIDAEQAIAGGNEKPPLTMVESDIRNHGRDRDGP